MSVTRSATFLSLCGAQLLLMAAGCWGNAAPPSAPTPDAPTTEITMEGSVPLVPHDAPTCRADCLVCHDTGANGAPRLAHPDRTECLLCHVVVTEGSPFEWVAGR